MDNIWRVRSIYILKKLVQMGVALIFLSVAVFIIARACPGDPLLAYYGEGVEHMSSAEKLAARQRLGLDDSLLQQYMRWAGDLFQGELGLSYQYKQPVLSVISGVWINTLILGLVSYFLTFGLAIALGMFCAMREDHTADRIICKAGVISANIPSFFLALLLILIFAVNLHLLPAGGAYSLGEKYNFWDRIVHLILPTAVMVLQHLWYYAYLVRNKLIEETRKDYVLLCKAEGIPRRVIMKKHCFKNILPSLLVIMAISVPHILGGTYVVEMVFSYPGLGTLSFESAMYQDYNMLMALTLLTGAVVLFFNMAAQALSQWIDPRMEYERNFTKETGLMRKTDAAERKGAAV